MKTLREPVRTLLDLANQTAVDNATDCLVGSRYPRGHEMRRKLAARIRERRRLWARMPDPDAEQSIRGMVGTAPHYKSLLPRHTVAPLQ